MVEIAIEKFKRYTLLGIDEIQIELIQAWVKTLCCKSQKLFILFRICKIHSSKWKTCKEATRWET
jgi:hypothetical protein